MRELLEKTCVGGNIALLDRNSLAAMDWRKVFAHKHSQHSETAWVLCNEHGHVINEPDQGCPEAGFSTESFLNDLDAQFYQFPPRPGVDGDGDGDGGDVDVVDHDLDLSRAKLVSTGVIGTVRTRDGSNDNNIPAHKVIFIHDVGCGEHLLIKHDEVEHELKILEEADDPVPLSMRASRLLRGSKASGLLEAATAHHTHLATSREESTRRRHPQEAPRTHRRRVASARRSALSRDLAAHVSADSRTRQLGTHGGCQPD